MSIDQGTFESLVPSRFTTFTFPNPSSSSSLSPNPLHTPLLRVAVLDSPTQPTTPLIAAMLVPTHRESDWTFSTHSGHLLLLLASHHHHHISRLILIGNLPSSPHPTPYTRPIQSLSHIQDALTPLLLALSPKSSFQHGLPEIPFLDYEDDLIRSAVVDTCVGSCVGEMSVEDVELEGRGFRRRLRFKRMPNLIQTQVKIVPIDRSSDVGFAGLGDLGLFRLDMGSLVQPYLGPMVASLSVIGSCLERRVRDGFRLKALCLGVGGGALVTFLNDQLGFEVVGVEADEVVLTVARKYFGLRESKFVRVCVGDGIRLVQQIAGQGENANCDSLSDCFGVKLDSIFDVIMVDLDSSDARMGTMAPPLEFVEKSVLRAARLVVSDHGILVINVIPPSRSFYEKLVSELQEFFVELYEIDVGNGENFVFIATASPVETDSSDSENSFLTKLKLAINGEFLDSIRKI
ncbi:hypothetical protein RHGRI_007360 [Rhododendron griersonianum]|uniref:S-adenosyl-L-methionine-dependent methyltransferase n=1 Tax=Rhododendron griersonianum TaxID=479676 RepID=A0AAV6KXY3_9ERIC|nr:hypothetical protein RHGRI_007360 [Rhododendron griersonianum]